MLGSFNYKDNSFSFRSYSSEKMFCHQGVTKDKNLNCSCVTIFSEYFPTLTSVISKCPVKSNLIFRKFYHFARLNITTVFHS